ALAVMVSEKSLNRYSVFLTKSLKFLSLKVASDTFDSLQNLKGACMADTATAEDSLRAVLLFQRHPQCYTVSREKARLFRVVFPTLPTDIAPKHITAFT